MLTPELKHLPGGWHFIGLDQCIDVTQPVLFLLRPAFTKRAQAALGVFDLTARRVSLCVLQLLSQRLQQGLQRLLHGRGSGLLRRS